MNIHTTLILSRIARTRAACYYALTLLLATIGVAHAQPNLPQGFSTQLVANGLGNPTGIEFAFGNRIYVAIKDGRVRVIQNGVKLVQPFVDYRSLVNGVRDRGLLGIALHPDFPNTPYVYLLFTYDPIELAGNTGLGGPDGKGNRVSRLIRLEADPAHNYNVAKGVDVNAGSIITDPSQVTVLLGKNSTFNNIGNPNEGPFTSTPSCENNGVYINDCLAADEDTHTIGSVRFGLDGSLFVTNGDGAAAAAVSSYAFRSQRLDSLNGKLMRIHPLTGEGYADNPYFNGDFDANRSRVFSHGLRNPFRMTVKPDTGEIYIGDVGWGRWEEINVAGVNDGGARNFGWPCFEGSDTGSLAQPAYTGLTDCQNLLAGGLANAVTPPLFSYSHLTGSGSIQLGDFYQGTTWPSQYHDGLFISDINNHNIRYIKLTSLGQLEGVYPFATNATGIAEIRSGPDTNLYYVDVYAGEIRRIVYTAGGNTPPTPIIQASELSGAAPLTVDFDASGSYDPDGDSLTYTWAFGDGTSATGESAQHTFTTNGYYTVSLTAVDSNGTANFTNTLIVAGNNAPQATIDSVTNASGGSSWVVGDKIIFTGHATDLENGALTGDSLSWNAKVYHNAHMHLDYYNGTGAGGELDYLDHDDNSYIEVCLTATDNGGLTDTACQAVYPQESTITVQSIPSGLTLTFSDVTQTTPFTVSSPVGSTRTLAAPATIGDYNFASWSNNGGATQNVTVPNTDVTYTATYTGGSQPGISINNRRTSESQSSIDFMLTLSEASAATASVNYNTIAITATDGVDYTGASGTVTIPAGATSAVLSIDLINDTAVENDERFKVILSNPTLATLSDSTGIGIIEDDDGAPLPGLRINNRRTSESAGSMDFSVTLNASSTQAVTVFYAALSDTAIVGNDFTATNGTLTFAAGETVKTISVPLTDDTDVENDEKLIVKLSSPAGATLLDGKGTGIVTDNDGAAPITAIVNNRSIAENSNTVEFKVTLSEAPTSTVTIDYFTLDVSATHPSDYTEIVNGTVTFAAGETVKMIPVSIIDDSVAEGTEIFYLKLYNANGAVISDGRGNGIVVDND